MLSKQLPVFDGTRFKATLVAVNYGPSEASRPRSPPCAVIGYATGGTLRFQVKEEPETTLKAGESFYEAPNAVHLVSSNASATEPDSFVAYATLFAESGAVSPYSAEWREAMRTRLIASGSDVMATSAILCVRDIVTNQQG